MLREYTASRYSGPESCKLRLSMRSDIQSLNQTLLELARRKPEADMKNIGVLMLLIVVLGPGLVSAQTPGGSSVQRLDPALDAIVSPNAKVEILKGDYFGNAEGPVWVEQGGYLLFSDIGANKIYKWSSDGKLSMFLDRAGFNGTDAQTRDLGAVGY